MRIRCETKLLQQAATVAGRAVSSRSTLPILSHLMLTAEEDRLLVQATDLEVGVTVALPLAANIDARAGRVCLPSTLLREVLGAQSGTSLELEVDEHSHATVRAGKSVMSVHGLPAEEFPPLPQVKGVLANLTLPHPVLRRMIETVTVAISSDETRARLTGALLLVREGRFRMVATDTHRLATLSHELTEPAEDISVIVPGRALRDLAKLLSSDESSDDLVTIRMSDTQASFETGAGVTLISRLIEGEFPNYRKVIPADHEWVVSGPVAALRESVRRCAIVSREDNRKLVLKVTPEGGLFVSSQSSKVGSADEEVDGLSVQAGSGVSEPMIICFNADYTLDGLSGLDADEFRLELTAPNQPAVLRPVADSDAVYCLMPMQAT